MSHEDGPWFSGREMLLAEIDRRIGAVRRSVQLEGQALAFRAGLLIFLERRVARLKDAMNTLQASISPISDGRRQTIDRMMSSVVETLRHAELEPSTAAAF